MTMPPGLTMPDQGRKAAATKVWLIPEADSGAVIERVVPAARRLAELSAFRGELGGVVATEAGILVGLGDGQDPFAVGAASAKLPEGDYVIANPLEGAAEYLAALGWALGAYRFETYKKGAPVPVLVLEEHLDQARLVRDVEAARLARDLVNTPADDMGPDDLQAAIERVGKRFGAKVRTTIGKDLAQGFPLIEAVGRAAAVPPRLVDLEWGDPAHPKLTLVGKGVCFDSGGLNIKGGTGMALMKKDMGGAANALALAQSIMAAELPYRLRLLVPAVENAIAGNAFRPGDVYRSRAGKTVEISNTDAEGRLILADALALAAEGAPARIISLATLTGAARIALGPDLPPLYSTDEMFAARAVEAGPLYADPVWPMPLWRRYETFLSSSIADVNHASSTSFAGSVTAALFLNMFVPETIPYTHLDIFAWVPTARPGRPQGGEAQGIRALFAALEESPQTEKKPRGLFSPRAMIRKQSGNHR
jgi:leucyl aminopeptidase